MVVVKKGKKGEKTSEGPVEQKKKSKQQEIDDLEKEIAKTKYNKRTERAIGLLKAKLARLKDAQTQSASKKSGKGDGYSVRKTGDGTVILIGFPSVGKSTILNELTGAGSPVGAYEFTTLDVVPGILDYNHAKIQILDVPGIVHGAASGKGRGKEVLAVMRSADLVLLVVDATRPQHYEAVLKEIRDSGIRMNKVKPDVKITRRPRGGIRIGSTVKLKKLDNETIKVILKEYKYSNCDIVIRTEIDSDDLIDVIEGNKIYIPGVVVLNKIDLVSKEKLEEIKKKINPDICMSQDQKEKFSEMKSLIYKKLRIVRVYCKEVGKEADLNVPLILFEGSTVEDMCNKLHKDFVSKFKFARVWGPSAKFPGQSLMLKHVLKDGDIVEIHVR